MKSLDIVHRIGFIVCGRAVGDSRSCMHTCTIQNTCVNALQQENSPSITNPCAEKRERRCWKHPRAPEVLFLGIQGASNKNTHAHLSELRAHQLSLVYTHAHKTCMHCKCHVGGCCRMIAARKLKMNTAMRIMKISFFETQGALHSWHTTYTR